MKYPGLWNLFKETYNLLKDVNVGLISLLVRWNTPGLRLISLTKRKREEFLLMHERSGESKEIPCVAVIRKKPREKTD